MVGWLFLAGLLCFGEGYEAGLSLKASLTHKVSTTVTVQELFLLVLTAPQGELYPSGRLQ